MQLAKGAFKRKIIAQLGRCFYCGEILSGKIEIDHILPFSKHKNGKRKNLCLSCVRCNKLKSDKEVKEFKVIFLKRGNTLTNNLFYFEINNISHG
jgi:5-methylcytosine-specific restriction endonuclease McrA